MSKNTIFIIKSIVFMAIFLVLFSGLCKVLQPKWIDEWKNTTVINGFYDQKEDSIDVLVLGTSQIMTGFSPMQLYNDYGMTGYICGTERQNMVVTYYWLEETLKTQKPKAVVLDVYSLYRMYIDDNNFEDIYLRKAFDYMKMSPLKIEALFDIQKINSIEIVPSFLFPNIRYHSRWKELNRTDFVYSYNKDDDVTKGLWVNAKNVQLDFNGFEVNSQTKADEPLDLMVEYFDKIVNLCKDNNIELVLIKTPVGGKTWLLDRYLGVKKLADERNLIYLDFNQKALFNQIKFDNKKDYLDSIHINIYGAQKVTKYVGDYLSASIDYEDKRNQKKYALWQEDYKKYEEIIKSEEIIRIKDIYEYLSYIDNERYSVFMVSDNESFKAVDSKLASKFKQLGLKENFQALDEKSYLGVISDGKVYEQYALNQEITYSRELKDGTKYSLTSRGYGFETPSSIRIDNKEYCLGYRGINVVVYDNVQHKVVDSVRLSTHDTLKVTR